MEIIKKIVFPILCAVIISLLTKSIAVGNNDEMNTLNTNIVYDEINRLEDYQRPEDEKIHMPSGENYTRARIGILTFRNDSFRQNASAGMITDPSSMEVVWKTEIGNDIDKSQTNNSYRWSEQPVIVKWSVEVREASNIFEEKREKVALREVIFAGTDGTIHFLDLEDGAPTRSPINLGYSVEGTPSFYPTGYPYMSIGQSLDKTEAKYCENSLRQFNLYDQEELSQINKQNRIYSQNSHQISSFNISSLIDRTSDTMITLDSNGSLYLIHLGTIFDYHTGLLENNPSTVVLASRIPEQDDSVLLSVKSSHAMYDRFVFYADMDGFLYCIDTDSLTSVWTANTGDSVYAAIALDQKSSTELNLYTANVVNHRESGRTQIRRFNAFNGNEEWCVEIDVSKNYANNEPAGAVASPIIGQNNLSDLVFFTVSGLNKESRNALCIESESEAVLVAIEKETGKIRWAKGLLNRSESSPVAVYDKDGNGWIIQCTEDGTIVLLDGQNGKETASLTVEGTIESSPAVYNNMMVIGATDGDTGYIYGISIGNSKE